MNNTKILSLSTIGLIFLAAIFYFGRTMSDTSVVTSIEGCYVATLANDVYVLQITSEQEGNFSGKLAFNNFEKDSSSGSVVGTYRDDILLGTYLFQSEGMDSKREVIFKKMGDDFIEGFGPVIVVRDTEKFQDTANVVYDQKMKFVRMKDCVRKFIDANNTFSFDYNAFFVARAGDVYATSGWSLSSVQEGNFLARVSTSRGYMPKTNFSEAYVTVGRSTDAQAIKNCTTITPNVNETKIKEIILDKYPFTVFRTTGRAAGSFYDTTSYRGIFDGDCYAIEYTIHSHNIGAYSPDQGIVEFDKTKIQNEMEKIVNSFKFLISSN